MKTGVSFAAIVLLVALAASRGFAEDAGSTARDNDKSEAAPSRMHGPSSSGDEGAGAAGNVGGSIAGGKPSDDIDTRITVQPHRSNNKGGRFGDNKFKIEPTTAARNVHRRAFHLSPPTEQTVRNAIGIAVPRHERLERHEGEHRGIVAPHNPAPAPGTTAATEGAGEHVIKPEGPLDRPGPTPNLLVRPPGENGRGISGTGVKPGSARHFGGTASLGGVKPTVNGINGTEIRRKH